MDPYHNLRYKPKGRTPLPWVLLLAGAGMTSLTRSCAVTRNLHKIMKCSGIRETSPTKLRGYYSQQTSIFPYRWIHFNTGPNQWPYQLHAAAGQNIKMTPAGISVFVDIYLLVPPVFWAEHEPVHNKIQVCRHSAGLISSGTVTPTLRHLFALLPRSTQIPDPEYKDKNLFF